MSANKYTGDDNIDLLLASYKGDLAKIADLRGKYPNVTISVDGGVNLDGAAKLTALGVNRLVAGSAIFESENITETIVEFQSIIGA